MWEGDTDGYSQKQTCFLCEGSFGANALQRMGCPQSKIKVQRLGRCGLYPLFFSKGEGAGRVEVAAYSNPNGKKEHLYTMKVFVKALEACLNMLLTFVGLDVEGIKRETQEPANRCRVQDKAAFLDWIE